MLRLKGNATGIYLVRLVSIDNHDQEMIGCLDNMLPIQSYQ
jgi:hypothetical protein